MQKNSAHRKIGLSKRPPRVFFDIGNGYPTCENFMFLRFHTASAKSRRSKAFETRQK